MPWDSHVSAPPSHPLKIPGHTPQACLQLRAAANFTKGCNSFDSRKPTTAPTPAGWRGPGRSRGKLRSELPVRPAEVPRAEAAPGNKGEEIKRWGWGNRGEQRVTLSMVDAKGTLGRLKEGRGEGRPGRGHGSWIV